MKSYIKKIVKDAARVFGYELIGQRDGLLLRRIRVDRIPYGGKLIACPPEANFDNVAMVLEHFSMACPGAVLVQVGANDGQTSDSVNTFVKRGTLRSVLIEPIPANFRKLEQFYRGVPNVQLVQAAISAKPGSTAIYGVRDAGRWKDSAWATQLASFDREHLLRHGIAPEEIEITSVECIDFSGLMKRCGLERIDVLQVDVEGYDAEVVKMVLGLPELPLVICFEFIQFVKHMEQQAVDAFYDLLRARGYSWSHDRINTMAVHERFVRSGEPAQREN